MKKVAISGKVNAKIKQKFSDVKRQIEDIYFSLFFGVIQFLAIIIGAIVLYIWNSNLYPGHKVLILTGWSFLIVFGGLWSIRFKGNESYTRYPLLRQISGMNVLIAVLVLLVLAIITQTAEYFGVAFAWIVCLGMIFLSTTDEER